MTHPDSDDWFQVRLYYDKLMEQALAIAAKSWADLLDENLPFNVLGLYPHSQVATIIFKSREAQAEAEKQGITRQILDAIPAAVAIVNEQQKPDPPIEIRSAGFANIDEIHEAGGPLNFFM